jgi:cellulose synthase/poly-beta-1,6-N-acetylglucosamine synthase-like glycosyltransferase
MFLAFFGILESKKRAHEEKTESYPLIYFSSLAIPVSIILPAHNEEEWLNDSLSALLNLNYPSFEIIVVDDGSTDRTPQILNEMLTLRLIDSVYSKHYSSLKIKEVFKSEKYPNVTVLRKDSGDKKAGAINAGLNLAQYRFVCVLDADTVLERDALIKVMAYVHRDPEHIIGIAGSFGLINGFSVKNGVILDKSVSYDPLIAYQNLEYIRSFIGNRIAWSRFNAMPNVAGGFGIWRSDILYNLGGYSSEFSCEDIEITFRVHDYMANNKEKGYKILMVPYYIGWTEGPSTIPALISQRDRWQRVVIETVAKYKYMFCNPKYGSFAYLVLPYFLLYEVFGVFFEVASIFFVAFGWLTGVLDIKVFFLYLILMTLSQFIISLLCLLTFIRSQKVFTLRYVLYLIFLAAIEFLGYRIILSVAKFLGTYRFTQKVKVYNQYIRAKRR